MQSPLDAFDRSVAAAREAFLGALPAWGVRDLGEAFEGMSDPALCGVVESLSQVARVTESLLSGASGQVAQRSRPELGQDGLAKKTAFSSPQGMIAAAMGRSVRDASKYVAVGEATATQSTFGGSRREPRYPAIAAALNAGHLSVAVASGITSMLDRVTGRADADLFTSAEVSLATNAVGQSLEFVTTLIKEWEGRLDPDGIEPREEELRQSRFLSVREERDGSIALKGRFDPVNGAAIKLAVEAIVSSELRKARDAFGSSKAHGSCEHVELDVDGRPIARTDVASASAIVDTGFDAPGGGGGAAACSCVDPDFEEVRTIGQMRADALADLARHLIGCDSSPVAASTTLVIRTDLDTLTGSLALATIDGVDQPISAQTARALAASAGIIPAVMGGASEVLDLGREQRLFTRAQKIALAERDGGCAAPGCTRPPHLTEAHHASWWDRDHGASDLDNGVLLCWFHHHLLHRAEWTMKIVDGRVWFIPPPHIDPAQRPRPGNNRRRTLRTPTPEDGVPGENLAAA